MNDRITERTARIVALLQEKVRLEPFHRRLFYLGFAIVWGSGFLWLLAEWFKDPELGPARTLLQTASMQVHGAAMVMYLTILGTLLTHVRRGNALRANRFSGFSMIALNGILALTGWMLYYLTDDALREWSSMLHWTIGLSSLFLLVAHVQWGARWARKLLTKEDSNPAKKTVHLESCSRFSVDIRPRRLSGLFNFQSTRTVHQAWLSLESNSKQLAHVLSRHARNFF